MSDIITSIENPNGTTTEIDPPSSDNKNPFGRITVAISTVATSTLSFGMGEALDGSSDSMKLLVKTLIESPLATLISAGIQGKDIKLKDITMGMIEKFATTLAQQEVDKGKREREMKERQNSLPPGGDFDGMLGLLFGGMFAAAARRESADPGDAAAQSSGTGDSAGVATTDNDILSMVGTSDNLLINPSAFDINPEVAMFSADEQVLSECQTEPENNKITSNSFNVESVFGGSGPTPFDIDLSILDAVEHECHLSNEAYVPTNGDPLDMGVVFSGSPLSRQEQDLQVWQQAEGERLTKLYQMALDKLDGNIDPNKLTCDSRDNSETHARISEAIKYLREMIDVAPDTGYGESAVEQRDRYVKMISHNFNTENLEEARLNLVQLVAKPSVFDRTSSIKSETEKYGGISLDGDITWSNGRELVNKVNRFIDLGGKLQTLTVNAHGENNITFTDESADRISGGNRRGVVYGNSPNSLPEAANWNEIHWEGAVNNNFTLWMGSCKGSDDARAIMDIIISQNRDIEGVVAFGRNYQGHWTGGDTFFSSWNYDNWPATDGHLGLVQYEQAVDGNIIKTVIPHPASQYLIDENNNRIWNKKNEFIKTLNSSSRTFPLFVQQLALYGNRSNK